jgi:phosphotransferase system HPr-like phosphotransfer protein
MVLNLNGFAIGGLFENLQYNTYLDSNLYLRSCATSCAHGIEFKQSNVNLIGFIGNNCVYPVVATATILNCISTTLKTVVYNSYHHGWQVTSRSTFKGSSLITSSKTINSFYNNNGMSIWTSSSYGGTGLNIMYNSVGIGISSSELRFFINYDNGTIRSNISYNTTGINVFFSGVLDVSYSEIHNNTTGVYARDSSNIVSTASMVDSTLIYNNTTNGIHCEYNSLIKIYNLKSYYNSQDGIFCSRGSKAHITNCEISNNGRHGIYTHDTSNISVYSTDIDNNTENGIQAMFNNKVFLYDVAVTNSGSYDLYFVYNSHCDVRNPTAKALSTNITPAKNTAPSYGNGTNGNYIIEYLY